MKRIAVLTHTFPSGGENFIDQEAELWAKDKRFSLNWFPNFVVGPIRNAYVEWFAVPIRGKIWKFVVGVQHFPWEAFLYEFRSLKNSGWPNLVRHLPTLLIHALHAGVRLRQFESLPKFDLYYSYWATWDALVAQVIASRLGSKSIVRSHGHDLYEGVAVEYIPFRRFLATPNGAPTVHVYLSESARTFAESRFGPTPSIIAPLGIVIPVNIQTANEKGSPAAENKRGYRFVSASNFVPEKRMSLIAEVLQLLAEDGLVEKWVHFGGTVEERRSFADNLPGGFRSKVELKGFLPNEEFRRELERFENAVFINLSSTEGMPVTIMEAMAAGLTVVASKVGGIVEMVSEETGLLVSAEISGRELSELITRWLSNADLESLGQQARNYAQEKFASKRNHSRFITNIAELLEID